MRRWGLPREQLLRRNVKRFRGGLVFKAGRLVYHSTLGWSIVKKRIKEGYLEGARGRGLGLGIRGDEFGLRSFRNFHGCS